MANFASVALAAIHVMTSNAQVLILQEMRGRPMVRDEAPDLSGLLGTPDNDPMMGLRDQPMNPLDFLEQLGGMPGMGPEDQGMFGAPVEIEVIPMPLFQVMPDDSRGGGIDPFDNFGGLFHRRHQDMRQNFDDRAQQTNQLMQLLSQPMFIPHITEDDHDLFDIFNEFDLMHQKLHSRMIDIAQRGEPQAMDSHHSFFLQSQMFVNGTMYSYSNDNGKEKLEALQDKGKDGEIAISDKPHSNNTLAVLNQFRDMLGLPKANKLSTDLTLIDHAEKKPHTVVKTTKKVDDAIVHYSFEDGEENLKVIGEKPKDFDEEKHKKRVPQTVQNSSP